MHIICVLVILERFALEHFKLYLINSSNKIYERLQKHYDYVRKKVNLDNDNFIKMLLCY